MPRDCPCTAYCQAKAQEESQNEFRMPELSDTVLDRDSRVALGIYAACVPHLSQLFRWIGPEYCRRQYTEKSDHKYYADGTQRLSKMTIRAKKMCRHWLWVLYQPQILSRPGCCVGVGLPSLYSHRLSPRTSTGAIRVNPDGKAVLACR